MDSPPQFLCLIRVIFCQALWTMVQVAEVFCVRGNELASTWHATLTLAHISVMRICNRGLYDCLLYLLLIWSAGK